jgi:hypothetical protein
MPMRMAVLAVLTMPALLTGCVGLIPVPSHSKVEVGRVIERRETDFVAPGRTSRAEVIERLGADFRASPRLPVLAYSWQVTRGMFVWWWCSIYGGDAGESEWSNWRAYFVAFDEQGLVTQTKFVHLSGGKSLDEQLEDWSQRVESKRRAAFRRKGTRSPGVRGTMASRQEDTLGSALDEGAAFVESRQGPHAVDQVRN